MRLLRRSSALPIDTQTFWVDETTPLRNLNFNTLMVGQSVAQRYRFTDEAMRHFADIANDRAPLHLELDTARNIGFDARIVQGLAVASRFSRLIGMYLPGASAVLQSSNFKFLRLTFVGQEIECIATITKVAKVLRCVKMRLLVQSGDGFHVDGWCQCMVRPNHQ